MNNVISSTILEWFVIPITRKEHSNEGEFVHVYRYQNGRLNINLYRLKHLSLVSFTYFQTLITLVNLNERYSLISIYIRLKSTVHRSFKDLGHHTTSTESHRVPSDNLKVLTTVEQVDCFHRTSTGTTLIKVVSLSIYDVQS